MAGDPHSGTPAPSERPCHREGDVRDFGGRTIATGPCVDASGRTRTHRAYVFPVAKRHYANHLGWSRWFYAGDDFPCQQIVWPDRAGLFPWEAGFDPTFANKQPDLTEHGWLAALTN